MKKREMVFVLYLIISVNVLHLASAAMAGVSPGIYAVNFEPNLKTIAAFNFMSDGDSVFEVYVEGDLAKYVKLDPEELVGGGTVAVILDLPSKIDVPGNHVLHIGARQAPGGEGGIGISANPQGTIIVIVPYPGKYATVSLSANNANVGEPVKFNAIATSLGKEDINAYAILDIISMKEKKQVDRIDFGSRFIPSTKSEQFYRELETKNYKAGNYNATIIVTYGGEKPAKESVIFKLGELFVDILSYSNDFERGKINRFNIEAESFWNDPIENLYANVTILDYNITFLTPSIDIAPWSKAFLTGYFDTTPIQEKKFKAKITLSYQDKTTEKVVDLRFKSKISILTYAIIGGIVFVAILLAIAIILLIRRKNAKEKKKKK